LFSDSWVSYWRLREIPYRYLFVFLFLHVIFPVWIIFLDHEGGLNYQVIVLFFFQPLVSHAPQVSVWGLVRLGFFGLFGDFFYFLSFRSSRFLFLQ